MHDIPYHAGYRNIHVKKFEIEIHLPRIKDGEIGTYTEKIKDGRRLQISGPQLMNWYFLYASVEIN